MEPIKLKRNEDNQISDQQAQQILENNVAKQVQNTNAPTVNTGATINEVANTIQDNITKAVSKTVETSNNVRDMTRDLTFLKGASDLQTNNKFTKQYQTELAGQLINDLKNEGTRQAIIDEAKKLEARNLRNEAYYNGFEDMFKMMKINKPFGIFPMVLLTIVILPIYLIFKTIGFFFTAINEVLTSITEFHKPAKALCYIVFIAVITVLIILLAAWFVDWLFGWNLMDFFRSLMNPTTV